MTAGPWSPKMAAGCAISTTPAKLTTRIHGFIRNLPNFWSSRKHLQPAIASRSLKVSPRKIAPEMAVQVGAKKVKTVASERDKY